MGARFVIKKVEHHSESEGPDYFTRGAFEVTDTSSGRVVAAFPWSLEEAFMANASYSGPDEVRFSDDGTEVIAKGEASEERVLLPVDWREITFDGVLIKADSDLAALARRVAREDGPAEQGTGFRQPGGQWLWKLHRRLGQTPHADCLVAAVAALLTDEDARARASALRFFYFLPDAPGSERICELAETARGLLDDREFNDVVAMRLRRVGAEGRWLELARRDATGPGAREPILRALAELDAAWLKAHLPAIARARPERWKDLLAVSPSIDGSGPALLAAWLVSEGVVDREHVLEHVTRQHPGWRTEVQRALRP